MSELLILGIVAAIFAIFVYRSADNEAWEASKEAKRKSKQKNQHNSSDEDMLERPFQRHNKNYTLSKKYAAVTIVNELDACDSVKALSNVRFLVRDAPLLPVRNCTKSKACECHYLHHTDRRKIDRRTGFRSEQTNPDNKRVKPRRDEDKFLQARN